MEEEIWKAVEGYEGYYEVSNTGRVRSLDRTVVAKKGNEIKLKGVELKPLHNRKVDGYLGVSLTKGGIQNRRYIHQIVAQSFLGHEIDGFNRVIDHIDGDRENNNMENLRIVSNRENSSTCYRKDRGSFSSKYIGVDQRKTGGKFRAAIVYDGENIHIGVFTKEIDAHKAYQDALCKINSGSFDPITYRKKHTSKYKGVYYYSKRNVWASQIKINGKNYGLGYHKTEEDAHNAYLLAKEQISNGTFLQLREQKNKKA